MHICIPKKLLCIFILALPSFFDVAGQATVFGNIQLADGEIVAGGVIQLLEKDSTTLIAYTTSDTAGYWNISGVDAGDYCIKISYLGCTPWIKAFVVKEMKQYELNCILNYKAEILKGVEVKTDRLGIVVKGDTLYYNLNAYIDSTEYNLGDILQKLPQISIDANGGISYKGQRVDVVLTEGKDIFGHLHKQMVEGIGATDVKSIQIIENYRDDLENIKQVKQDKVALNVQLTEEAKGKISGNARGVSNFYNQFEGLATAYKTAGKFGYTAMFRSNNVARPVISPLDILNMIDFENLKVESSAKMEDLLPEGFIAPLDTKKNSDIFGAGRFVVQPRENIQIKSLVYFAGFKRFSENSTSRDYLDSRNVFAGTKRSETPSKILFSDIKIALKYKKKLHASFYIPFTLSRHERRQSLSGNLNENKFENKFSTSNNTIVLAPEVKFGYTLNSRNSLSVEIRSNIYHTGKIGMAGSQMPLFGTADSTFKQKTMNKNNLNSVAFALQSKIRRYTLVYTIGLEQSLFDIDIQTAFSPINEWNVQSYISGIRSYAEIQGKYEYKKFRYTSSFRTASLKRIYGKSEKHTFFLPSGRAGFYYDFNKTSRLFFNFGIISYPADLHGLIRVPQIIDGQTLAIEKLDSTYTSLQKYAEIIYMNSQPTGKYSFRGNLRYSDRKNSIFYQTNIVDNYFVNTSLLVPSTRNLNTSLDFGYKIKRIKAKLNLTSGADIINSYTVYDDKLFSTDLVKIYSDLSLHLSAIRYILLTPGVKIEQNDRFTTQLRFNPKYQTGKIYMNFQHKSPALFAKINFAYQKQFIQKQTRDAWLLDFELEYSNPKIPFKINLVGYNILNFHGTAMLIPDFNANYTGVERFTTIGGQVMMGVNYIL
jgi:hypothetical protein